MEAPLFRDGWRLAGLGVLPEEGRSPQQEAPLSPVCLHSHMGGSGAAGGK